MAKSFESKRTLEGVAVKDHTVEYFHQSVDQAEKEYGPA